MVQFGDKLLMVPLSFITSQDIVEKQLSTVARCKPLMRALGTRPIARRSLPTPHPSTTVTTLTVAGIAAR